jgi:hypothetical protein
LQVNDTTANYSMLGIPSFAKQVCLFRTDPGATGLHLTFYCPNGSVVAEDHFSANEGGPMDVPPWAAYFAVLNDGPAQATNIRVVFDLCI